MDHVRFKAQCSVRLGFLLCSLVLLSVNETFFFKEHCNPRLSLSPSGPSHRDRAVLHCQFCGKRGHAHNFMRSKRFCSTSCARGWDPFTIGSSRYSKQGGFRCADAHHGTFVGALTGSGMWPLQKHNQVWKCSVISVHSSVHVKDLI